MRFLNLFTSLILVLCFSLCYSQSIENLRIELETKDSDSAKVRILNAIADLLHSDEPETALKYAKEALALALKIKSDLGIANGHLNMGIYHAKKGDFPLALDALKQALQVFESINNKYAISKSMNWIGIVYKSQGDFAQAMSYSQQALKIAEDLNDSLLMIPCLNNIGSIMKRQDMFGQADQYYQRALDIAQKLNKTDAIFKVLNNLGTLHYYLAHVGVDESVDYNEDNIPEEMKVELEIAYRFYYQAYEMAKAENDLVGMVRFLNNIGIVHLALFDFENAISTFQNVLEKSYELDNKREISAVLLSFGFTYLDQDIWEKAIEYARKSLEVSQEINSKGLMQDAYYILYQSYSGQKDFEQAFNYFQEFSRWNDSLHNERTSQQITEMEAKYQSEKKEKELALKEAELSKKDIEIQTKNGWIYLTVFSLVLVSLTFLIYRQRMVTQMEHSKHQIAANLREIEILRSNIRMEMEDSMEKVKVTMNRHELNKYLLNPMSDREIEVLFLVSDGKTKKEIADDLFVSENTIKTHVQNIYDKLGVNSKIGAIVKAGDLEILRK